MAAHVCERVEDYGGWPSIWLDVFDPTPEKQSIKAGLTADQMSWRIWIIGQDGEVSLSETRSWQYAVPDY